MQNTKVGSATGYVGVLRVYIAHTGIITTRAIKICHCNQHTFSDGWRQEECGYYKWQNSLHRKRIEIFHEDNCSSYIYCTSHTIFHGK